MIEEIPNHKKRILFEFVHGFLDGKTADSLSPDSAEASWAEAYFLLSDQGAVGTTFELTSDAAQEWMLNEGATAVYAREATQNHQYRIEGKDEDENTVYIRAVSTGYAFYVM